jgi:uncharacterized protein YfaP (DUF2135 family)
MKKIIYIGLCCLIVLSCKKDQSNTVTEQQQTKMPLSVGFYKPASEKGSNLAQVSVRNNVFQFTAIGNSFSNEYTETNSLFFSDTQSKTEWVILLDNSRPAFMYRIDPTTKVKSPGLYTFNIINEQLVKIRYYQYDWTKRQGKLEYETEVNQGEAKVLFASRNEVASASTIAPKKPETIIKRSHFSTSFPGPVFKFELLLNKQRQLKIGAVASADVSYGERLISLVKDSKEIVFQSLYTTIAKVKDPNAESLRMISPELNMALDQDALSNLSNVFSSREKSEAAEIYEPTGPLQEDQQASFATLLANETFPVPDWGFEPGVLQVELTWDTDSTDLDLHVTNPDGFHLYFDASDGPIMFLDVDDQDGFGPETVLCSQSGPDGIYQICIMYYGGVPITHAKVRVTDGLKVDKIYLVTIENKYRELVHVASVSKSGGYIWSIP